MNCPGCSIDDFQQPPRSVTQLPAVWICRDAVITVGDAVTIDIAVLLVSDTVAITVTIRAAALPLRPAIVAGCGYINRSRLHIHRPWLYIHRSLLHIDAGHLHAHRKGHVAAGVRRRSRRESEQCERDGCV